MYLLDVPSDTDNMILQLHQKDRAIYGKYKKRMERNGSTVVIVVVIFMS